MYDFNYFKDYVKPKSNKGPTLMACLLIFLVVLGLAGGALFFLKSQVSKLKKKNAALTQQIEDPALEQQIRDAATFLGLIQDLNQSQVALDLYKEGLFYLKAVDEERFRSITEGLVENSMVYSINCDPSTIGVMLRAPKKNWESYLQTLSNLNQYRSLFYGSFSDEIRDPFVDKADFGKYTDINIKIIQYSSLGKVGLR